MKRKMLVTTVGMRTEWGKLMETLNEGGDDETPLQSQCFCMEYHLPCWVMMSLARPG